MESRNNYYNVSLLQKWYTILLLLLPTTTVYASPIPSVSMGELILLLLMLLLVLDVISKGQCFIRRSPFYTYLMYAFIATIMCGFILGTVSHTFSMMDSVQRMIRDAFYFFMALVFAPVYFNHGYGIKVIRTISFILIVFVFVQFAFYGLFHTYIPGIVPQLKTTISGGFTGAELTEKFARNAALDGFARPNGFLGEPASVAQYLSIGLLLELFPKEGRANIKTAVFYSIGILITFSVNGYVALAVCWALWALHSNRGSSDRIIRIVFFIILFIVVIIVMMQNPKTASIINRLVELKDGSRTSGSSVIRVIRGPAFYLKMPMLYQLFGSGFGNFIQFKEIYQISTVYEQMDEYMNTNAYILISSGIVGFAVYLVALFVESRRRTVIAGMLAILILVYSLSCSLYSSAVYAIMLAFIITARMKGDATYEN